MRRLCSVNASCCYDWLMEGIEAKQSNLEKAVYYENVNRHEPVLAAAFIRDNDFLAYCGYHRSGGDALVNPEVCI
eukprot:scaffold118836_cov37-Prasinocladus_malaysianus.AAC.1